MTRLRRMTAFLTALSFLVLVHTAVLAEEVGKVAAAEVTAEIGRDGNWSSAAVGTVVNQGDTLRTGKPGKLRVVFRDDSVLNLGPGTELAVTEQVFDPNESRYRSVINLLKGKVRAVVSDYYKQPRATYEVKTRTAVAGVRGTEFVMSYDDASETTEVVGIDDTVSVLGANDPRKFTVLIRPRDMTSVLKGAVPSRPRHLEEAEFQQYLQGVQFIGGGAAESLTTQNPIVQGAVVPQFDSADATIERSASTTESTSTTEVPEIESAGSTAPDASELIGEPPAVVETIQNGNGALGIEF